MDIYHEVGSDIQLDSTNDLLFVFDTDETNQRIMRRLLTNKSSYIWNPEFGASIPARIGRTLSVEEYRDAVNAITAAVLEDDDVLKDPAPEINLQAIRNGFVCYIRYYNKSNTEHDTTLAFEVT